MQSEAPFPLTPGPLPQGEGLIINHLRNNFLAQLNLLENVLRRKIKVDFFQPNLVIYSRQASG